MSELDNFQKVNLVIGETESEADLVQSPIVGEKFSTSGMLLDPYEAVLEHTEEEIFDGIPADETDPKWMEEEGTIE